MPNPRVLKALVSTTLCLASRMLPSPRPCTLGVPRGGACGGGRSDSERCRPVDGQKALWRGFLLADATRACRLRHHKAEDLAAD